MKINLKTALLGLLLGYSSAHAATITVVGSTTQQVFIGTAAGENSNVLATVGSRAVVGFFRGFVDDETTRTALSGTGTALTNYIQTNFVPLGSPAAVGDATGFGATSTVAVGLVSGATSVSGGVTGASLVFASGTANAFSPGGVNRGTRMFLLVYDAPTSAEATQLGIFSATNWTVPTTTSSIMSMTLNSIDSQAEVFRGKLGSLILAPINPVPEASSSALALLAGLGLMSRRRR
jgi:hypothetical protein